MALVNLLYFYPSGGFFIMSIKKSRDFLKKNNGQKYRTKLFKILWSFFLLNKSTNVSLKSLNSSNNSVSVISLMVKRYANSPP